MEYFEIGEHGFFAERKGLEKTKAFFSVTHEAMLYETEGLYWLDKNKLDEVYSRYTMNKLKILKNKDWGMEWIKEKIRKNLLSFVNLSYQSKEKWHEEIKQSMADAVENSLKKKKISILALGDVGGTVLTALKLLGGDIIEEIGIWDISPSTCKRWEYEMNQTAYPWEYDVLPDVKILKEEELFDCDVFIFCASKGIPPLSTTETDVRMAQFHANREIIRKYAKMARQDSFRGLFAVVSDPVDPLCKEVFLASNEREDGQLDGRGLRPEQIQGYGLGVMNSRAAYYAKKDDRYAQFLTEGRAFGPHGNDLVIADSIENYNDSLSKALTKLAVEANLKTREAGFKPYIAPALSSAAISILLTLRGQWHYSSNFLGGIFMGCKNRTGIAGLEMESLALPESLYKRLEKAYRGLEQIQ
ncbi:lactate dehydrogenase [Sinanaerobacter sp. ZZT-01]|uniref:lactate dehydrogenase n=1 Tax=Sinanaerobacter sp. ZZT-01 TaxID=3111540 RepID=UPI002D7824ED|nr:lactate dehydrogenase [Sinanaerobacter sp. ZZT-01]WRR92245.1 lactate dehydrogenase [Sinanaerobacter sp. ZZT-01]